MTLPLFLTPKLKYPAGLVMFGIAFVLYMVTNHFPMFEPTYLPMTAIDNAVPFLPWTIFIYTSEYLFFTAVYITCRDMENVNKYLYSFFFTQAISCLIFFVWPTTFPRDLYPVPSDSPWVLNAIWTWLRTTDAPTNCFPSLHVSTVYLSSYIFLDEQKGKFPFFFIWGTLIALSTLPTKQHYFADVAAGWLLSVAAYYVFHRKIRYVRVGPLASLYANHQAKR